MQRLVPNISNTVVWYDGTGDPCAAIVTRVNEPGNPESSVALTILFPSGFMQLNAVPYGQHTPQHWGWLDYELEE